MAFKDDFKEFLEKGVELFTNNPGLVEDVDIRFFPSGAPIGKSGKVRAGKKIVVQMMFTGGFQLQEQVDWNTEIVERLGEKIERKIKDRIRGLQQSIINQQNVAKRALENVETERQKLAQTRMLDPSPLEELALAAVEHGYELDGKHHSPECQCKTCRFLHFSVKQPPEIPSDVKDMLLEAARQQEAKKQIFQAKKL